MTRRVSKRFRRVLKIAILLVLCFHLLAIAIGTVAIAYPNIFKRYAKYYPELVAAYPHENVAFAGRLGNVLHGWFFANKQSSKAVVMCHGRSRKKAHEMPYVRDFLKDYNVFVFDFNAHGDNARSVTSIGYHESADVLGAIDWLQSRGFREIALVGHSMGGAAAIKAAAEYGTNGPGRIAAVVTEGAFADLNALLRRQAGQLLLPPTAWWPAFRIAERMAGYRIAENSPERFIRRVYCPVLIMQAETDYLSPPDSPGRLRANAGGAGEVIMFEGRHDVPCEAVSSNALRFVLANMPP